MSLSEYSKAKLKLIKGFIQLLENNDFLQIEVKQLCKTSGVNRSTFYAYYDNTFELLNDCKKYMIDTFLNSFSEEQINNFKQGKLEKDYITKEYLLPYLKQVKQNKTIYKTYAKLKLANDDDFFEHLLENVAFPVSLITDINSDKETIKYVTKFYTEGINAIVNMWIKRDFKESEEKICAIIINIKNQ